MTTTSDPRRDARVLVLELVRSMAGSGPVSEGAVRRADPVAVMEILLRERLVVTLGEPLMAAHGERLPSWFGQRVAATRDLTRRAGLLQHGVLGRITRALSQAGVPVAPLKGAAFADAVHGDFGARESTDIDLLVEPGQLDAATAALASLGWREDRLSVPARGLPRLHRVLEHDALPPVELHWRVHWYEESFSTEALRRARPTAEGWLRPQPADELAFLLLFLARDGFAGLRQAVDVAAWWRALGSTCRPAGELAAIVSRHPALAPAIEAAATAAETTAGLPPGCLLARQVPLDRAQRAALRLANPWLEGSAQQIDAEVSLIDGLLAPRGRRGAFTRRRVLPPAHEAVMRRPELEGARAARLAGARGAHAVRVVGRYVLALPRVLGAERQD